MIGLVDFLKASGVGVSTESLKVHLACRPPRGDNPLDVFLAGNFDAWQSWQNRKNFPCSQVLSLIDCSWGSWLFAGVYSVEGRRDHPDHPKVSLYDLKLLEGQDDYVGRLFIKHQRKSRPTYIWYKHDHHNFPLSEIRPEKLTVGDFPGYKHVVIAHGLLKIITQQGLPSWRSALSHVRGIYLITDTTTGKPYVGKADGNSGLWQRWCEYANTGHGGNKELRKLLAKEGAEHASKFQFSILEIMEPQASEGEVLAREEHWMSVLHSRTHGLNGKPDRAEEEVEDE